MYRRGPLRTARSLRSRQTLAGPGNRPQPPDHILAGPTAAEPTWLDLDVAVTAALIDIALAPTRTRRRYDGIVCPAEPGDTAVTAAQALAPARLGRGGGRDRFCVRPVDQTAVTAASTVDLTPADQDAEGPRLDRATRRTRAPPR